VGGDDAFPIREALRADGPLETEREGLMLFGQFVGAWQLDVRMYDGAGRETFRAPGQWTFAWLLDGRVVQDVIAYPDPADPSRTAPGQRRIGTTVRRFNPASGDWTSVWLAASSADVGVFRARAHGGEIWLEMSEDNTLVRWRFTEIGPDRFRWLGETSEDGGATWALGQEMLARRQGPEGAA
jgi:hypothetical protein